MLRQLGTRNPTRLPAATGLVGHATGFGWDVLTVGEEFGHDARIVFAGFLERGASREDLGREDLEVYRRHDEAVPRNGRFPRGRLIHTPDLYAEDERKRPLTYSEFLA